MNKLTIKEVAVFGMLGAIMYVSKVLMASLPNIHLIAVFIAAVTTVYRRKALYPIYVYVLLEGIFGGFTVWFLPYLYVWLLLWGVIMLLPADMPERKYAYIVYMVICGLHGILYGTLCTFVYAPVMGLDFKGAIDWIIAGLPYDLSHCLGNFCLAILTVPLIKVLRRLKRAYES